MFEVPVKGLLSLFLTVFWLISCHNCRYVECIETFPKINFHYLSATGEDLLDGPAKKYNLEDFRVFSRSDGGSTVLSELQMNERTANQNAFISAIIRDPATLKFLEVRGTVTDTFDLDLIKNVASECCGESTVIKTILWNKEDVSDRFIIEITEH